MNKDINWKIKPEDDEENGMKQRYTKEESETLAKVAVFRSYAKRIVRTAQDKALVR